MAPQNDATQAVQAAQGGDAADSGMPPVSQTAPQPTMGTQPQPQAQAAQPPAQQPAPPSAPPKPGSFFHNLSHAFMGAVIGQATTDGKRTGGIGGRMVPVTDPNTGAVTYQAMPQTVTQRMGELSRRILTGLASIPDSPEHPSPIKGLGTGFVAAQQQQQAEQEKVAATEAENFKRQQDLKMQQYDIAYKNTQTQALSMAVLKARNDLNPLVPESRELMEAVKNSPDLAAWQVQEVTQSQLHDMMKDGHHSNSQIVPLGLQPVTDTDGNPMMRPDGTVMSEMHYGLITGPSGQQHQGNIVLPPGIAAEIAEYGPKVGLGESVKSFTAGSEMPVRNFVQIMGKVDEERTKVVNGWNVPTIGLMPDGKTPAMINGYDHSQPPRKIDYLTPDFEKETAMTDAQRAAAEKDRADAKQALATAAMYSNTMFGAGAPPTGSDAWNQMHDQMTAAIAQMPPERRQVAIGISHQVSPQIFSSLLAVANGDQDFKSVFPSRPMRGTPFVDPRQATMYVKMFNPQWNEGLYDEKKSALKDFGSGKDGQAIGSFNRFLVHAAELKNVSDNLVRTNSPFLNTPLLELQNKYMGQPGVPGLIAAVVAPREEWESFLKNGHASDLAQNEESRKIVDASSTPAQIFQALQVMAPQAIARLDTIDQEWSRQWGGHYPGLVTPQAYQAAQQLGVGDQMQPYAAMVGQTVGGVYSTAPASQNPPSGQPPQTQTPVPGRDKAVFVNGVQTGYVINGVYVANPPKQ